MKKNKRLYRIFSVLLIVVLSLQMMGCTFKSVEGDSVKIEPMELEEVYSYSFDFIGGKDVMPIMGYYGPNTSSRSYNGNNSPTYISEECFKLLAESGINVIGKSDTTWSSAVKVREMLELGEKYNLGVLVNDSRVIGAKVADMTIEDVDACVNEYANYPAYVGNYVCDEPHYAEFYGETGTGRDVSDFAPSFQRLSQLGVYAYGNLFPAHLGTEEGYQKYLEAYLEQCPVKALSYDHYPFDGGDNYDSSQQYFKNLTMIRQAAESKNIPFWVFIQAGSQWNDALKYFDSDGYYPSQGSFYWNVGTALAFGAKGLQYFPLLQPMWFAYAKTEPFDFQRNGLLGAWQNKTRWYYYAQDMNAQIAAVDEVLMNSVNKGVIATCDLAKDHLIGSPYLMKDSAWRELKSVDGDALIGCFNYNGKTALYVVNYDIKYAQNITLQFHDTYNISVTQNAETSRVSTNNQKLTLSAGNSALIVFE